MINYERIAAEAAELARQFWLEIEAEFTQQVAGCQGNRPDRAGAVADTLTIGRDAGNDIVLESITVSRFHALLLRDADEMLLADLESTNGTLLNGVLVRPDEPVRLADGDVIHLGEVVARYAARRARSIGLSAEHPTAVEMSTTPGMDTCDRQVLRDSFTLPKGR
jgi:predicted component of type VI protein secretion system